ncbi:MAG: hypothetical protein NT040_08945 [Bacteroidetes bacterium]|nr:hypothetical protein [Bacteroidota bacterium]
MDYLTSIGYGKAPPGYTTKRNMVALLRGGHHPPWRGPTDA